MQYGARDMKELRGGFERMWDVKYRENRGGRGRRGGEANSIVTSSRLYMAKGDMYGEFPVKVTDECGGVRGGGGTARGFPAEWKVHVWVKHLQFYWTRWMNELTMLRLNDRM